MALKILRKYGVSATINFALFQPDGTAFKVDAVHTANDTTIMKNEGAEVNTTNGFVDEGTGYSIVLTATEMQAARIVIYISDQTVGPDEWLDDYVVVETFGHASAQFPEYPADVEKWNGVAVATPDVAGYPVITIKDDTGSTQVARVGADGDTLETLSDQVDGVQTDVDTLLVDTGVIEDKIDIVDGNVDAIVAKLPSGIISDLDLATVIDGITLEESIELVQAMVDGRILKDTPEIGDLTFYKRDNSTILTITRTTDTERIRL